MIKHKLIKMMVAVGLILATSVTTAFAATTGWTTLGNSYGYKDSNGQYVKGWQEINGKWYYFSNSLSAVKGYRPTGPNRVYYHFNDDWSWDGGRTYTEAEVITLESNTTQPVTKGIPLGQQQSTANQTQQSTVNQTQSTATVETEPQLSKEEFYDAVCKEMFKLVNDHRSENNVSKLEWSDELNDSAKLKSQHMVDNNYYSHNWDGIDFKELSVKIGGSEIRRENIAATYNVTKLDKITAKRLSKDLFTQWKNSYGHDIAMLYADYTEFGFGYAYNKHDGFLYATQQFR